MKIYPTQLTRSCIFFNIVPEEVCLPVRLAVRGALQLGRGRPDLQDGVAEALAADVHGLERAGDLVGAEGRTQSQ